jgi:hypothetical protein
MSKRPAQTAVRFRATRSALYYPRRRASRRAHTEKPLNSTSWLMSTESAPHASATELIQSHRARIALQEAERVQLRREELAAQHSDRNPPDVRIRIWEKLHGLRLPSDATHPILDVIAVGTRLTLAEVREEQRVRLARRAVETVK